MIPGDYQQLHASLATRARSHPLVVRKPLLGRAVDFLFSPRFFGYAAGSVVAFVSGNIAFVGLYLMGASTTTCSIGGFVCAAVPNWILNRRWAWRRRGNVAFGREIIGYIAVSIVVLVSTSAATGWTNAHVQWVPQHYGIRALLVTATYVAVTVVLFFAKFVIYNYWIFSGRSRVRPALRAAVRSLRQVPSTARANRTP